MNYAILKLAKQIILPVTEDPHLTITLMNIFMSTSCLVSEVNFLLR
jgi:hypothetical protein